MSSFQKFGLRKQLFNAIEDLGFVAPTPIQDQAFSVILSGKDILGIAQTGTGKTLGYMLPLLDELKFSKQLNPRILILVPTRELVIQVQQEIDNFTKYLSIRTIGIYGGVNIKRQSKELLEGSDIVVATPGRLYDLILNKSLRVKGIKKLVIDEVDVILDLGFKRQISNIFELLPQKRQNIMFSATITEYIEELIDEFFITPVKISIALSGTPLDNISQQCYKVANFNTKVNLLENLLRDKDQFKKVLVFVSNKKMADKLFESIEPKFGNESCIIHSNKSQNYRIRSIENFDSGLYRILVSTDIMSRGLDLDNITHVINFDTPEFPENYMHRIGRTGRAEREGKSLLFYTDKEKKFKNEIEDLMSLTIPILEIPDEVEISKDLIEEEKSDGKLRKNENRNIKKIELVGGFHEKKEENNKINLGGSYRREIKKKYKKPKTRGDKTYHKRQKRG
jgi:ATP-dependent RNA helicase RhlE